MNIHQQYFLKIGAFEKQINKIYKQIEKHSSLFGFGVKNVPVIGFCGAFSVGKSTTINQILRGSLEDKSLLSDLGQVQKIIEEVDLSPVDIIPTTACGIHFKYGENFAATFYRDKSNNFLSDIHRTKTVDDYINFIQDRKNLNNTAFIEIELPHPLLRDHYEIIDMPGGNSIYLEDQAKLLYLLDKCDALIYLFPSLGISRHDEEFLTKVLKDIQNGRDLFRGPISFWLNYNEHGVGSINNVLKLTYRKLRTLIQSLNPYFATRFFEEKNFVHFYNSNNLLEEELEHFYQYLKYFALIAKLYHIDKSREFLYCQAYQYNQRLKGIIKGEDRYFLGEVESRNKYLRRIKALQVLYHLKKISLRSPEYNKEELGAAIRLIYEPSASTSKKMIVNKQRVALLGFVLYGLKQMHREQQNLKQVEEALPALEEILGDQLSLVRSLHCQPLPVSSNLLEIEELFHKDSIELVKATQHFMDYNVEKLAFKKFEPIGEQARLEKFSHNIKTQLLDCIAKLKNIRKTTPYFKNLSLVILGDLKQKIISNRYILPICGPFSSGKSSFINTLLDCSDILPVDNTPTTAYINEIKYGSNNVVIHWKEESIIHIINQENRESCFSLEVKGDEILDVCELLKLVQQKSLVPQIREIFYQTIENKNWALISPDKLYQLLSSLQKQKDIFYKTPFLSEKEALTHLKDHLESNTLLSTIKIHFFPCPPTKLSLLSEKKSIQHYHSRYYGHIINKVEIYYPLDLLRDVHLVDTPGFNSIVSYHDEITEDYLFLSDSFLYFMSASQALTSDEIPKLKKLFSKFENRKKLGKAVPNIFIVITKIDELRRKKYKTSPIKFVEEQLSQYFHLISEQLSFHEISIFDYRLGKESYRLKNLIATISESFGASKTFQNLRSVHIDFTHRVQVEKEKLWLDLNQASSMLSSKFVYKQSSYLKTLHNDQKILEKKILINKQKRESEKRNFDSWINHNCSFLKPLNDSQEKIWKKISLFKSEKDFLSFKNSEREEGSWKKIKSPMFGWREHSEEVEDKVTKEIRKKLDSYSESLLELSVVDEIPTIAPASLKKKIAIILEESKERKIKTLWIKKLNIKVAQEHLREELELEFENYQKKTHTWLKKCDEQVKIIHQEKMNEISQDYGYLSNELALKQQKMKETKEDFEKAKKHFDQDKQKLEMKVAQLSQASKEVSKLENELNKIYFGDR